MHQEIASHTHYFEKKFEKLIHNELVIEGASFECCHFKQCEWKSALFSHCRFVECTFEHCHLSLSKWLASTMSEVSFNHCMLLGINWTELQWPLVKLTSPLYFESSNLSHSSFFGLELTELFLERCKVHEVDFRDAKLSYASFAESDLENSLFMHTELNKANFVDAFNYNIDTKENNIKDASFSFPEVVSLLRCQGIKIVGYDSD